MTETPLAVPDGPGVVNLMTTPRCNLACFFCPRNAQPWPEGTPDVTPELLERILDTFPTIRSVFLGGGEPFLCRHLPALIETARDHGLIIGLSTNAAVAADKVSDVPLSLVNRISVSINECDRKRYHRTCGRDCFDAALYGLRSLVATGARVGVSFALHRGNFRRMREYLRFSEAEGVGFVTFLSVLPPYRPGRPDDDRPFREEMVLRADIDGVGEEIEASKELAADRGIIVDAWPRVIDDLTWHPKRCQAPNKTIGFDGRGCFSGCCAGDRPRVVNGHLDDGASLWNNNYLTAFRLALATGVDLPVACRLCPQKR